MNVWVVLRDDGTRAVAEYSVDSIWSTREAAHARGESLITPYGFKVEIHTLDSDVLLAAA